MIDYFGFIMVVMNERGSVFVNLQRGENVLSIMLYCLFNSWMSNSEVRCVIMLSVYFFYIYFLIIFKIINYMVVSVVVFVVGVEIL